MAYSKEKQQKLVSSLTSIGALAGNNTTGIANGIKGLGLSAEQTLCNNEAKAVRDGLFKVAVMGTFSSGKSTVINALIGSKVLPEAAMPCTAILTFIQYGSKEDEGRVDIYMADEMQEDGSVKVGNCIPMSINEFQEKYKYTLEDENECKRTGTVARFAKVKYAVMYCSKPLMEGGVCIIDSPGLEDKAIATELALKIAKESQAIIYVSTEKGYAQADKEYIVQTFRNCPNNVFFVINKFDLVKKDERDQVLDKTKVDTESVFTSQEQINRELQNRRVFGISALRALDSRRGMTYNNEYEEEMPLSDNERKTKFEKSWFRPFEQELETFLTTDEKCVAQYQKCFRQMTSTYHSAEIKVAENIHIFENNISMDAAKKEECAIIISNIENSIRLTEATFDNCSLKVQNAVADLLSGCVNSIDASWEQDMLKLAEKVDVSTLSFMWTGLKQINPFASKQSKEMQMKKFTSKFIDAVTEYFIERVENYIKENIVALDNVIKECQDTLDVRLAETDSLFRNLSNELTSNEQTDSNYAAGKGNWLQIIISAYLGDYSQMFKNSYEKVPWIEFLKKTMLNTVWQVILITLVDGGIGALLAIIIEYMQGRSSKNDVVKKILNKSKDGIVKAIRNNTEESRDKVNKRIAVEINEKKDEKCADAKLRLNDAQTQMKEIEAFFASHTATLEDEKKRFNDILDAMFKEAADAYSVVFGKQLTLQAFKQF